MDRSNTGRIQPKGLVQVYTGDGKGKTTAALGLALRAVGYGYRVYIGQFLKGTHYGELDAIRKLAPQIIIQQYGSSQWIHLRETDKPAIADIKRAKAGLSKLSDALCSGDYDIVVADEIFVALHFKLLKLEDIIKLIKSKPRNVELVLTGRKAPPEIFEYADLVTEMREIRHPYQTGILARRGIEF